MVGSGIFAALTLTEANGRQWRLVGEKAQELSRSAQLRHVTVTGHTEGRDAIVVESWAWAPEEKP